MKLNPALITEIWLGGYWDCVERLCVCGVCVVCVRCVCGVCVRVRSVGQIQSRDSCYPPEM